MFEIGSSLREARHRKGLDLPEVEHGTKIRAKYLRALEEEQFDLLPSQTYVKGFLHSYAEYLGLDGKLYVDEYTSRFWVNDEGGGGHRAPRRVRVRRRNHRRFERNMIIITLVLIGVVTALVIAAWRFGSSGSEAASSTASVQPVKKPARTAAKKRDTKSFIVQARGGSSLVEVHAGSAAGKLVYHGTVERGESQRFSQRSLWLNVGSPEHLLFTFKGRTVKYSGPCPRVIVVTPKQVTSTSTCR
jgi:cytoskeletal protein RodZ